MTLDGPDGWAHGWITNGHRAPLPVRRQQGGGGARVQAAVIKDERVGPCQVEDGLRHQLPNCQFLEDMHPSTPLCSWSANAFDGVFCHWMEINRSDGKQRFFFNCVGYETSHSFKLLRQLKHFAKENLHSCWDLHKETAAQMLH